MAIFLYIYCIIMMIVGAYSLFTTIFNILYFKKMAKGKEKRSEKCSSPLVSIIIPARDEEVNLPRLLSSLIKQTYQNIEILIINDQSTDKTSQIIKEFEALDSRVHGFDTEPGLKISKHGKMNALLQLIPHAKGEYLLATDADTQHATTSIAKTVAMMQDHNLDIMSGFPTELCSAYMASLIVSSMMFANIMVPHFIFYKLQLPQTAFAIGQYIIMRRDAYFEVGGYGCIENDVVDDMGLVKLFVRKKKKYAFVNLSEEVGCYMYDNGKDAFKGIERSISGIFPAKLYILPVLFLFVTFLMMIAWAPLSLWFLIGFGYFNPAILSMLVGWIAFCLAWFIGCRNTNFRKLVSLSCPLSITAICAMYVHGVYRRISGKNFVWKGRII